VACVCVCAEARESTRVRVFERRALCFSSSVVDRVERRKRKWASKSTPALSNFELLSIETFFQEKGQKRVSSSHVLSPFPPSDPNSTTMAAPLTHRSTLTASARSVDSFRMAPRRSPSSPPPPPPLSRPSAAAVPIRSRAVSHARLPMLSRAIVEARAGDDIAAFDGKPRYG